MRYDLSCLIDCRICRSSGSLGTPGIFDSLFSQFFQCFNVSNWNWTHCANPGHEFLMSQMSLLVSHIPDGGKGERKISWVTELHMLASFAMLLDLMKLPKVALLPVLKLLHSIKIFPPFYSSMVVSAKNTFSYELPFYYNSLRSYSPIVYFGLETWIERG